MKSFIYSVVFGLFGTALQAMDYVVCLEEQAEKLFLEDTHEEALSLLKSSKEVALLGAAKEGNLKRVKGLIAQGASVDCQGEHNCTPLINAIDSGHDDIVTFLLEQKASVHQSMEHEEFLMTPLHRAVGSKSLLTLLLKHGARITDCVDDMHTSIFHKASICEDCTEDSCNLESVVFLSNQGADPLALTTLGRSPLSWAAYYGCSRLVDFFLKKGCSVQEADYEDNTPLHWAAGEGHLEVVECLLEHGAEVDARTTYRTTPLQWAAEGDHPEVIACLLKEGAALNAQCIDGMTALHRAAQAGSVAAINIFFMHGVDYLTTTNFGVTALHIAVQENQYNVCESLIENVRAYLMRQHPQDTAAVNQDVANYIRLRDDFGKPAVARASKRGFHRILSLFLDQMVNQIGVQADVMGIL